MNDEHILESKALKNYCDLSIWQLTSEQERKEVIKTANCTPTESVNELYFPHNNQNTFSLLVPTICVIRIQSSFNTC